jgi:hypothetical protein
MKENENELSFIQHIRISSVKTRNNQNYFIFIFLFLLVFNSYLFFYSSHVITNFKFSKFPNIDSVHTYFSERIQEHQIPDLIFLRISIFLCYSFYLSQKKKGNSKSINYSFAIKCTASLNSE